MRIGEAFPSNYIRAADLQGRDVLVTMADVKMEDIGSDHKPVLYFKGKEKGLVLNKTNGAMISELYGDDTDAWFGKPIGLYPTKTDFQGKRVDAIRVKPAAEVTPSGNSHAAAPPPRASALESDDIPFAPQFD